MREGNEDTCEGGTREGGNVGTSGEGNGERRRKKQSEGMRVQVRGDNERGTKV